MHCKIKERTAEVLFKDDRTDGGTKWIKIVLPSFFQFQLVLTFFRFNVLNLTERILYEKQMSLTVFRVKLNWLGFDISLSSNFYLR